MDYRDGDCLQWVADRIANPKKQPQRRREAVIETSRRWMEAQQRAG